MCIAGGHDRDDDDEEICWFGGWPHMGFKKPVRIVFSRGLRLSNTVCWSFLALVLRSKHLNSDDCRLHEACLRLRIHHGGDTGGSGHGERGEGDAENKEAGTGGRRRASGSDGQGQRTGGQESGQAKTSACTDALSAPGGDPRGIRTACIARRALSRDHKGSQVRGQADGETVSVPAGHLSEHRCGLHRTWRVRAGGRAHVRR